jgi:hypothetical protein
MADGTNGPDTFAVPAGSSMFNGFGGAGTLVQRPAISVTLRSHALASRTHIARRRGAFARSLNFDRNLLRELADVRREKVPHCKFARYEMWISIPKPRRVVLR